LYTFIIYYYFNEYIYYILKLNYKTLVYTYYLYVSISELFMV
jgi:hypothetical protein